MGFNSFHFCKSLWNRITWSARDNKLKMAYYSEKLIHCTINFIFLKLIFLTEAITVYCADDHTTSVWSLIHGAVCFDQWSENEDETIYLYFLNGSNHTLVLIFEASTFNYVLKAYRGADNHSFSMFVLMQLIGITIHFSHGIVTILLQITIGFIQELTRLA